MYVYFTEIAIFCISNTATISFTCIYFWSRNKSKTTRLRCYAPCFGNGNFSSKNCSKYSRIVTPWSSAKSTWSIADLLAHTLTSTYSDIETFNFVDGEDTQGKGLMQCFYPLRIRPLASSALCDRERVTCNETCCTNILNQNQTKLN